MIELKRRWYALYTKSRAEKRVASFLEDFGFESYLPLQKTLKQWSDRKKIVYEPLFRSYVFVKANEYNCSKALQIPGAVYYVSFNRQKVTVPEFQIEAIKTFLGQKDISGPLECFEIGNYVEVIYGSLMGLRGELISCRNHRKLIIRIDAINQNIALTLPSHLLKKIARSSA